VEAKRGDTHYGLSIKFLTEKKGLPSEKAREILDKMAVVEDMVPGFQVWMMYDETTGVFGSFVTQGTASITPRRAQVRSKRALLARIEKAQEGRKKAEAQVETLASEKAELQQQMEQTASALQAEVEAARREKEEAQRLAEEKERERLEAERRLNSFFYTVGNLNELKKRGVVKGGGIGQAGGDLFSESLDLRLDTVVSLSAGDAGLGRIGSVKVFPSSLRKGRDYDIFYGSDRQLATVKVLNREAFLQARRVVFGIED
jgi:membrane-associated HD superfamily phosphohydrolase